VPYTEPLDPNAPADSDDVADGDDSIRQTKRAFIERLLTVFQDLDVNPLEFIDAFIKTANIADGAITGPKIDPAMKIRSIITEVVLVTATLTFPHGTYVHDYTVTGAEPGDIVVLSWYDATATFVHMHAWVSAADTVKVTIGNDSDSSGLAYADQPLAIIVIKPTLLVGP